jgi:hypothetical protein
MQELRLTIRKRAFPSKGRVRLNIAHLDDLGIKDGENVDLVSEATGTCVTTIVVADTMVREGQVRVSAEDLEALGLEDNSEVLLRKTPPLQEKLKKAADNAGAAISKGAASLDKSVAKAAGDLKTEAGKAAGSVKKGAGDASDRIGKAAKQTAKDVKDAVKKATGDDSL